MITTMPATTPEPTTLSVADDPRWARIVARDKTADGHLWYSVSTTGVYCRPSCPSRIAKKNGSRLSLWASNSIELRLCGRMRSFDCLDDFEPFEFRVAECERLALASVLMGGAELFGLGPFRKIVLRRPN
jgi:Metal binding domain of Ada